MAGSQSLFRQESIDRMQSPEKVDEYIRVSTPRAWILACALFLIVAGVLVWGFTGSIPKTVSVNGVLYRGELMDQTFEGEALCLLPVGVGGSYLIGHEAHITFADGAGISGTVADVAPDPLSFEEVQTMARSDWRMQMLWGETDEPYQYALVIDYDHSVRLSESHTDRELVTVSVVLSDVKPISFVFN